jgi:RNase adapter protein RapZ
VTDILLITGLSGAGRSEAAAVLEDLGWYVVDNLPTSLVGTIVELASTPGSRIERLALVAGRQHLDLVDRIASLRGEGHQVRVLFLDAGTAELVRRYESSRRLHPMVHEAGGLLEAIEQERTLLDPLKRSADLVIDTSRTNVHELKHQLVANFDTDQRTEKMQVVMMSFGFKHGIPLDADIVMDVRFLPNPHWVEALRPFRGIDQPVRDYVFSQPMATAFVDQFESLLADILLPEHAREGRSHLTVAIGCTGGHHRSVAITEELTNRLLAKGFTPRVHHRDLRR